MENNFEYYFKCLLRVVNNLIEVTPFDLPNYARENIANDIANEWEFEYFTFYLNKLKDGGFDIKIIKELIKEICDVFNAMTNSNDKQLWTIEGFVNSNLWKSQRIRALNLKNNLLSMMV